MSLNNCLHSSEVRLFQLSTSTVYSNMSQSPIFTKMLLTSASDLIRDEVSSSSLLSSISR